MQGNPPRSPAVAGRSFEDLAQAAVAAAGFGLGGAVVGVAGDGMLFAFALMGALGAAALSPIFSGWKRRIYLVLAGSLGFLVGFALPFFSVLSVWEPPSRALEFGLIGSIGGALGGGALGAVSGSWKTTGWLALTGALGFGIGLSLLGRPGLHPAVVFGVPALAAGALMGFAAALGKAGGEVP